ncbi:hypothetical protein NDU88_007115 [Pleurodeles waltl]|uniref:Uncharacterized protein n=1 Tax=Pleurodeles waltl TaxID=8319 RepID=A0AAV7VNS5_PLEWA|nr:hypothetical protein NDU88_007115 [Pleurodeles waltl]
MTRRATQRLLNEEGRSCGVLVRHGISQPLRLTTVPQVKEVCLLWPLRQSCRRIHGSDGPKYSVLQLKGEPPGRVLHPTAHRDFGRN